MAKKGNESSAARIAKLMKQYKIERTSGMCPWGCGHTITNGGGPLISHLNTCRGRTRKVRT